MSPQVHIVWPIHLGQIEAVEPHASPQVVATIDLHRLTGAQAGELVIMQPIHIDISGNAVRDRMKNRLPTQARANLEPFLREGFRSRVLVR